MIRPFLALTYNGFREARRNRVTIVVAAFAAVLVMSSSLTMEVTVTTMNRVLIDVGLGTMSLTLVLLAIFLSSGLLPREIERRTIFMMMSRPLSRGSFLVARLAGNMLTLTVLLAIMTAFFLLQLALYQVPMKSSAFVAIGMLWFELLVLSSFGFLMSSFASQVVSAVTTTGIYFAGHLSADIYRLGDRSKVAFLRGVAKAVYYALPNLDRLNLRPRATYDLPSTPGELVAAIAYGLAYSAVLIALATLVFGRRDFK